MSPPARRAGPCLLFRGPVQAGFPSPAEGYTEERLDLNRHLVKNAAATFFVRAAGESMLGAGIHPGDILVVDRSLEAVDGSVVIAVLDGELVVKRLSLRDGGAALLPENESFEPVAVNAESGFSVWGVVTHAVHELPARPRGYPRRRAGRRGRT